MAEESGWSFLTDIGKDTLSSLSQAGVSYVDNKLNGDRQVVPQDGQNASAVPAGQVAPVVADQAKATGTVSVMGLPLHTGALVVVGLALAGIIVYKLVK